MNTIDIVIRILLFVLAPAFGCLFFGIDRKLTARMQNRVGPPLLQPWYDFKKLMGKTEEIVNRIHLVFAFAYVAFIMLALGIFLMDGDLLIICFSLGASQVFLALGAFSVRSPYSHVGAHRLLLQMVAVEPLLGLAAISIKLQTGSFLLSDIYAQSTYPFFGINTILLLSLPFAFFIVILATIVDTQKSPFDISTAHSEIVSGTFVEYSGPYLAITKLGHWFELFLLFGFVSIFFNSDVLWISIAGKLLLDFAVFLLILVIDNSTARLTIDRLVKFSIRIGLPLIIINIVLIVISSMGVIA